MVVVSSAIGVYNNSVFIKKINFRSIKVLYISKVSDRSRGRPEGPLFNSYHTEV